MRIEAGHGWVGAASFLTSRQRISAASVLAEMEAITDSVDRKIGETKWPKSGMEWQAAVMRGEAQK